MRVGRAALHCKARDLPFRRSRWTRFRPAAAAAPQPGPTEFGCGAGPSKVKDSVDSEDGYSFNFNWEVGARYRLPSGLMVGLSYMQMKNHYGATESYRNAVFSGVDDDFGGFMISAGLRF